MAVHAVVHVSMAALYAPLERYFGSTVRLYRVIMWAWPLTIVCAPLLNLMARRGEEGTLSFNIALFIFFVVWAVSGFTVSECMSPHQVFHHSHFDFSNILASMSIMVTETAPSPAALATINVCISILFMHPCQRTHSRHLFQGLSQMAIILPQAIAPAFVTSLFAFSIQSGIAGGNLIWIILFCFSTSPARYD